MGATLKSSLRKSSDPLITIGAYLAEKLEAGGRLAKPTLLSQALHDLLDGQDDASKALRVSMQIHLAKVSNAVGDSNIPNNDEMLSTEQAAMLMDCSRPYVAMLIDAGKLAGGVKSPGGHRKVPKSSVLEWIASLPKPSSEMANYRKAAKDLGMYSIPEENYVKALKRSRNNGG
jgi:excisionase family DNA binding protein